MSAPKTELKRVEVELSRVSSAKMEMELKIIERLDEIEKMQDHIKVQEARERELMEKIKEIKLTIV
jgi:hypothetical protein